MIFGTKFEDQGHGSTLGSELGLRLGLKSETEIGKTVNTAREHGCQNDTPVHGSCTRVYPQSLGYESISAGNN